MSKPQRFPNGVFQSPIIYQRGKCDYYLMYKCEKMVRNWADSQSKNICYFNKSLGIERLPFSLENKTYFRTTGSYSPPSLEKKRYLNKVN